MKSPRVFSIAASVVFVATGLVGARLVRIWPEEELLAKSDLVVVATPTTTHDTGERLAHFLGFDRQAVIGVGTTFAVSAVLKGDRTIKELVLDHYRPDGMTVPNAPTFLSFDPAGKLVFRLFLVRKADGHYTPVSGQENPEQSVKKIAEK